MPTLVLDDVEIYYERRGRGPRLLVFNGSGGSIAGSEHLLDRLTPQFDVLVHDQRCLGASSVPDRQPTMAAYASDAAALLDHVGWASCRVFGISFGGMVAQEFAVTWPERVERLALLCTSSGGVGGASYPLHDLATLDPAERDAVALRNLDSRFDDAWLAEHPRDKVIVEQMVARASASRRDEQRRGETMQLLARKDHDVCSRLASITAPTLVACGIYDGTAPPANSEAIHARIPGSELRRYEGGHLFVYQDRRAFPELIEFLA